MPWAARHRRGIIWQLTFILKNLHTNLTSYSHLLEKIILLATLAGYFDKMVSAI